MARQDQRCSKPHRRMLRMHDANNAMTSIWHGFLKGSSCPIVAEVEDKITICATNEYAGSRMLEVGDH